MFFSVIFGFISGNQFIRRARSAKDQNISKIPAIAITAYPKDIHEVDSLNAGFDRFLSKFSVGEELIATICELLDANPRERPFGL